MITLVSRFPLCGRRWFAILAPTYYGRWELDMAKTESTAVNALIDQVQGGKSQSADPGADLF